MGKTSTKPGARAKSRSASAGRRKGSARPRASSARSGAGSNGRKLVIVESPAKARTINRYLGGDYVVKASMGHVRDLPAKQLGVDLEGDFSPTYELVQGRRKLVAELKNFLT